MDLAEIEKLFARGRYLEVRLHTEKYAAEENHLREKQLYALALSKSGASGVAERFFRKIYEHAPHDSENAGIMGGILKELFRYTRDQHYAVEARKIYLDNFNETQNYYTGINAASMHAITGRLSAAREIAKKLISTLQPTPSDFWEILTLAEAKLLVKQTHEAVELFNKGRKLAGNDWGKVNIIYKQLWLMNHYFPIPSMIIKAFSPPKIAAFMGHMIDRPGERTRFPSSIQSEIKTLLAERIKLLDIQVGYCSLACGGDILFAEALTEACGDVNIYLPFQKEDFLETSVRFGGQEWVDRFELLEKKWPVHYLTHEKFHGNPDVFALQGRGLMGSAILRAQMSHSECYLLTVLSGVDTQRKEGGTRDMLKLWPNMERYMNIDPGLFNQVEAKPTEPAPQPLPVTSWSTLYLGRIFLPQLSASDAELNKMIDKHRSEFEEELLYTEIRAGQMIIGMNSSYGVVRLGKMILDDYKTKTSKQDFRIVFHAGMVNLASEAENSRGKDYDDLATAMKFALPSNVMCTGTFATSLVLDPGNFLFRHAGIIDNSMEMYIVEPGEAI